MQTTFWIVLSAKASPEMWARQATLDLMAGISSQSTERRSLSVGSYLEYNTDLILNTTQTLPLLLHSSYLECNTVLTFSATQFLPQIQHRYQQITLRKIWINEWWMNDEYITYFTCIIVIGVHTSWKITGSITTGVLKYKTQM